MNHIYKTLEFDKILIKLAQYCSSSYTKDKVLNASPSSEIKQVKALLAQTNEAMELSIKYLNCNLPGFFNIKPYLIRAQKESLLLEHELLQIASQNDTVKSIIRYSQQIEKSSYPIFIGLVEKISPIDALAQSINYCIDDRAQVRDEATPKLKSIRFELKGLESSIRQKMNQFVQNRSDHLTENILTTRNNRFVVPVKASSKTIIKGIIHDESSSGQTLFIEPEFVIPLNNRMQSLNNQEQVEIEKILHDLLYQVINNIDILSLNLETISEIDLMFAKSSMALKTNSNIVTVNDNLKVEIYQGRHPLIDPDKVVANDFFMANNQQNNDHIVIISGSNTGGKTVNLKMVGLFALMNQYGLALPVKEGSSMPVYSDIFADIGDEQSIEQSLSTFSSHMTKIKEITDCAQDRSLVLFDELGSGTDPKEGESLALAILDYLHSKGVSVIATTHYSRLKSYAIEKEYVKCASVAFDIEEMRPTYRLSFNLLGSSNAIDISSRLGLNQVIINQARDYKAQNSLDQDELMLKLNMELMKVDALKLELEDQKKASKLASEKLALKLETLEETKAKEIDQAKLKANQIIEQAKLESKKIIDELKSLQTAKQHELIAKSKELDNLKSELIPVVKGDLSYVYKINDHVEIISLQRRGQILSILDKDMYMIALGNMKVKIHKSDLRYVKPIKASKPRTVTSRPKSSGMVLELNLIGKRVDEALPLLERFLDQALVNNAPYVRVVHGFGTGALRKAVHDYLKKMKFVKEFHYGDYSEGGQGATIVKF